MFWSSIQGWYRATSMSRLWLSDKLTASRADRGRNRRFKGVSVSSPPPSAAHRSQARWIMIAPKFEVIPPGKVTYNYKYGRGSPEGTQTPGVRMKPVALAIAALVTLATHAQARQDDVDKVHVRIAKKVA